MPWFERHARWTVPLFFAVLAFIPFGNLLWSTTRVVSSRECDMQQYFLGCRSFAIAEVSNGNLPLWNPHSFGGEPYLGNFHTALFYPPNRIHLALPLATAINWVVALHVFLAGYFTYLWCRGKTGVVASMLGGAVFMFCGAYFFKTYAGHLPHLCVMVWTPLMLRCIDGLSETGERRWVLIGIGATTMHILAGHPQYVYYTALAVAVYAAIKCVESSRRPALLVGVLIMYLGAVGLSAIQLFTGLEAAGESLRGGTGATYTFASRFAFPVLNWISLIAPRWFGAITETDSGLRYWACGFPWEQTLFVGVCPVLLALYSLRHITSRRLWPIVIAGIFAAVIAMGRFTPLHRLLFDHLPGYSSFRGTAKMAYFVALAIAYLAANGFDAIRVAPRAATKFAIAIGLFGVLILVLAAGIERSGQDSQGLWSQLLRHTADEGYAAHDLNYFSQATYAVPLFISQTAHAAMQSTAIAGTLVLLVAAAVFAVRYRQDALHVIVLIALGESLAFAVSISADCDVAMPPLPVSWTDSLVKLPSDQRVLVADFSIGDLTTRIRRDGVWGYDPNGLRRWGEFMFVSQGSPASEVDQYMPLRRVNRAMFQLVRCGLVLTSNPHGNPVLPGPMAVAQLIGGAEVVADRDKMLSMLATPDFNPRGTVLLETPPAITPAGQADSGTVTVLRSGTDELELQAEVKSPAILLVTNAYSRGWRVESIGPSPQAQYDVQPADWALQGIPLTAGSHHLLLFYLPMGFRIGRWVSLVSLVAYGIAAALILRRTSPQNARGALHSAINTEDGKQNA